MNFTSKIEYFTRHNHSNITDVFERRHDIVSSIVFIDICSRLPRNQFISEIPEILLSFEEKEGSKILIFLSRDMYIGKFQMFIEFFYLIEIWFK